MSLTPAADDPNRKEELARKKKNPDTFGTSVVPASTPHEEAPNGGLKTDEAPQDEAPQDEAPQDEASQDEASQDEADWTEFLDQSVDAITAQLNDLSDEQLADMSAAEASGKNRKTLLSAIADQLEVRAL